MATQIDKAALGARIRAKRLALGISQREMGRRMKIAHGTLATWGRGQRAPTIDNIARLAGIFHRTVHDLMPEPPERLNSPIVQKRLTLGMSARALSKALGFSEGLICRWERGEEKPTPKNAVILAKYFKCPVEEIYPEWKGLNAMTQIMALRGITPAELSKTLGIRLTGIVSIASESSGASIELAGRIAAALGCTVEELGLSPTVHTQREDWKKAPPPEVIEQRNNLFGKYSGFIGWTMRHHSSMMKASRVEACDAWGALALALCKALDRWIETRKDGNVASYILTSLKFALFAECERANGHGITNAPKDGSFTVCSLDALLESDYFIPPSLLEATL